VSQEKQACSVSIMDKEYLVSCPEGDRDALHQSVEFLNSKMKEMRDSGKAIGTERIAVMVALNMAHELMETRRQNHDLNEEVDAGVKRIRDKIEIVLQKAHA